MLLLIVIVISTRLSIATVIPNKKPDTIVKHMLKYFIQPFGQVESFLSDNGGEFINQQLLELCDIFGIKMKTTAAESPWSNGLIERHNLILSNMLDKVLLDVGCNLDIAVAWCCNAKNSLHNIQGFSPYQLAIGCNPTLPNTLENQLPAQTNEPVSHIIKENLNALHKAREAFIQTENSEKIKRALSLPVRTSGEVKYFNGDRVYYKRKDSRAWHGPATVLGQDGQQVLLKHGGVYVRVHPCRLNLIRDRKSSCDEVVLTDPEDTSSSSQKAQLEESCDTDSDDEDIPSVTVNESFSTDDVSQVIVPNDSLSNDENDDRDGLNDELPVPSSEMVSQTTPNDELTQPEKVVRKSSRVKFRPNYKDMHLGISTQPILKGDTTSLETDDNAICDDSVN